MKKTYKKKLNKEKVPAAICTYGLSAELPKNDPRHKLFKRQRKTLGFDETELWNLDLALAKFMLPRLRMFKSASPVIPYGLTRKEWHKILSKIIIAFEIMLKNVYTKEDDESIEEGLGLFRNYLFSLSW